MSNVDPTLAKQVQEHPEDTFRVIVRVQGDLGTRAGQLEELGLTITRTLRLIRGFGAAGTGACVLKVTSEEWVISIEPDREVRTMDRKQN